MVYHKKFVASLKCNGKILREHNGDEVYLPYGSSYSIILKNLNTIDCKVKIFIDGNSALDNNDLIIASNQTVEIERFVKNNNLSQGNKFKFIEKTSDIENFRDNRIEDGLIRIEYYFEKQLTIPQPLLNPQPYWYHPPYWERQIPYYDEPNRIRYADHSIFRCGIASNSNIQSASYSTNDGITVPGEISNQEFSYSSNKLRFFEENANNIILKLIGQNPTNNEKIQKPITVKDNPICSTCGRKNKFNSKFCNNCGTSLILL